jgi:hypothetical protein
LPNGSSCSELRSEQYNLLKLPTSRLTSATRREAAEVTAGRHDGCFSSSRTCEIGMTRATGQVYRSYIYLLEHATRP